MSVKILFSFELLDEVNKIIKSKNKQKFLFILNLNINSWILELLYSFLLLKLVRNLKKIQLVIIRYYLND